MSLQKKINLKRYSYSRESEEQNNQFNGEYSNQNRTDGKMDTHFNNILLRVSNIFRPSIYRSIDTKYKIYQKANAHDLLN